MRHDLKRQMQDQARLTRGLLNVLNDDVDCLNFDVNNFDLHHIETSIVDTKNTLRKIFNSLDEIGLIVDQLKRQ